MESARLPAKGDKLFINSAGEIASSIRERIRKAIGDTLHDPASPQIDYEDKSKIYIDAIRKTAEWCSLRESQFWEGKRPTNDI